jgi:FMN reductase
MTPDRIPHLLCLSGSLRTPSNCFAVCEAISVLAQTIGFEVEIADPRELKLPMYEPDFTLDEYAPNQLGIERLIAKCRNADAMVWVSPTYHGTVSGVFKNMLDFAEFLSGDSRPYLQGRAVGLISVNDSTTFAAMRDCVRELRAWLAPTHIELSGSDFTSGPTLSSAKSLNRVQRLVDELYTFARSHSG